MTQLIQTYLPNVYELGWSGDAGWGLAIWNTLYMTIVPFIVGGAIGLFVGLLLVLMGPGGVIENKLACWIIDKITSIFRAIPFIILIAILASFTYLIMGTILGATAALVPLTFATFPFFARQVQLVFSELDKGVIEAAQASGATFWDIVKVYLSEGLPDLIRVSTVTLISLVGETAMAGAIGAGGLGNVAISYGYNRFNNDVTWVATIIILLIIFAIQFIGDSLTRRFSHK
ncbi:methionine ABC transporter permease [Streptococcus dysgalactiae]|uniref:methionine ABC transporter permease n=1 Tax=Streptococcus dysgalactiae TaxID=1334 RepID=UPI000E058E32|nr:methionine ABC transporter permease [Streptococcus dysgalactiae]MCB2828815.1 ABC transporter permease [Streptococcus dysgalactiae subsp. dysgalactiae]MCB2831896.1 ABC transporter permease [Streptococcus dysgalactiae subsp. dysgalactiae]MCB2834679.1 ABC transporter permease [Streptococcus dysgalactiae subsp. dysgalactiae]MCB2836865.1 ABC transporter permease [Streptococcus dysgalactiae subsp. dysgalactiae]MCB2838925.1 ABC transporter permease [Streptococcus dysgalactiae subsp. dysgalactiae]